MTGRARKNSIGVPRKARKPKPRPPIRVELSLDIHRGGAAETARPTAPNVGGSMQAKRIPLRGRGGVRGWTLVDADDFDTLSQFPWHLTRTGYARRERRVAERVDGGPLTVQMHQQIMGLFGQGRARYVDHINGDKLDNRRANLRIVTPAQSQQNRGGNPGTSRYRGVSWKTSRQQWRAAVWLDGKQHNLGYFDLEEDAGAAASAFRAAHMPFSPDARGER